MPVQPWISTPSRTAESAVLQTAAAAASISPEVVPEQASIAKVVAVPTNVRNASTLGSGEVAQNNDLPAIANHHRLILSTDIDLNVPYIPSVVRPTLRLVSALWRLYLSHQSIWHLSTFCREAAAPAEILRFVIQEWKSQSNILRSNQTLWLRDRHRRDETCQHGVKLPVIKSDNNK